MVEGSETPDILCVPPRPMLQFLCNIVGRGGEGGVEIGFFPIDGQTVIQSYRFA